MARRSGQASTRLCEHAFAGLRQLGPKVVEIWTGGDPFHAPARALYESLDCVALPLMVYFREP
ncbi:hypothetical protein [Amycolatopsis sp. WQ 127309]|uniref:hypothetical protein n=1 Tax=Amycolatopsis sp. WQ 127309 TaxID=2932773 RepID=UPI001FF1785C|nr:hypothetical protein [Amycolatopsis sp. WQ 127309]UOZ04319.1 hypothetical protein MUY22_36570 [Amycolatopsis sp. WQ 127309]